MMRGFTEATRIFQAVRRLSILVDRKTAAECDESVRVALRRGKQSVRSALAAKGLLAEK